jgi:HK97 family phage major capsid protein
MSKPANDTDPKNTREEIEEVQLAPEDLEALVDKTKTALMPEVKEAIKEAFATNNTELQTQLKEYFEKNEKSTKKPVKKAEGEEDAANDPIAKGIADGTIKQEIADMTPAMRFMVGMKALMNEDQAVLKQVNRYNIASQKKARLALEKKGDQELIAKTGYANETTTGDGAVLVPDAEFVTTLFENLPKYGVAFSDADVRQTDRTAVRVISLDSGLTFYATAEGGVKTAAKLSFSKNEVSLQKYAVIVPATDELTDDSAIDYWNVVTRELTRAYAKKADEVVFTDAAGSASGSGGITNQSGVLTHTFGASLDWDDLLVAQSKTEDDLDESNFKWYLRKETWYYLIMRRADAVSASDGAGVYLGGSLNTATGWVANPNTPTTPWGTPVKFTRVLPSINTVSANDAIGVYGDLRNYLLYNKRGMALKLLTEAVIVDADSVSTNLATQDISAMRAVIRLLGILPKGNRTKFVVLGKGTVS